MPIRLVFGAFELDESRFELRRHGQPVGVQPKVLDLIFHLARNRERVVTKEELFHTLWEGVVVSEASLSQAVSLARRALDDTTDAQHTIRTVRSKGLQFVATEREASAQSPLEPHGVDAPRPRAPRAAAGPASTALETECDEEVRGATPAVVPTLFASIHCEAPATGGAGWSLADVDEVELVRGSERRTERRGGSPTRVLTISLPGKLMSRRHARILRTPAGWLVVDDGSRNGTFVNEERVDKRTLGPGDVVECGRTLLLLANEPVAAGMAADADSRALGEVILPAVTPRVAALGRDLERLATSEMPVLFLGESGVGKTHAARALHGMSHRAGPLVTIEAGTLSKDGKSGASSVFARARGGTVLLENIDRLPEPMLTHLASAIDAAAEVRLLSTSTRGLPELEQRLSSDVLMRLAGYRCEIPPLRERPGDLGVLVAALVDSKKITRLELDVRAGYALLRHGWPGNLRELARTIEAAATLSGGALIRAEHLLPQLRPPAR